MQVDNVSKPEMPGFGELGISPHSDEEILQHVMESLIKELPQNEEHDWSCMLNERLTGCAARVISSSHDRFTPMNWHFRWRSSRRSRANNGHRPS